MGFNRYMLRTPADIVYRDTLEEIIDQVRAYFAMMERDPVPSFEQYGLFLYGYEAQRGDKADAHTDKIDPAKAPIDPPIVQRMLSAAVPADMLNFDYKS